MTTDTDSHRREVLRALIDNQFDGIARQMAIAAKKPAGQINDMLSNPPRKSFGEKIARQLEKQLGLKDGYFDKPLSTILDTDPGHLPTHRVSEPKADRYAVFSPPVSEVIQIMETLTNAEQRDVVAAVKMFLMTYHQDNKNSSQRAAQ